MNTKNPQPWPFPTASEVEVHLDFAARINLDGTSPAYIAELVELGVQRLLSEGMITGDTAATIEEHRTAVTTLTQREADLSVEEIVAFYQREVDVGALPPEEVIPRLVAMALKHPAEVRRDLAKSIDGEKQII